jgi:predicted nucleotidyltransferase
MIEYNISAMLDFSRSKLRKDLFRLYFSNPDRDYYLRELERLLGHSVANIRRELIKLEKAGVFIRQERGNLTYYGLNKRHPLYEELTNIVAKTIGIEGSVRNIVARDTGIQAAFIYGSYAAGAQTADSDIDVLIIGRPDEQRLMAEIDALEKRIQRDINYTVYSLLEYRRRKKVKDSFIVNVIQRPKILLKGAENEV